MGRTLGVIADRVFASAHRARVVERSAVGAHLTRLVLESDEFTSASTDPCDVTAFRVSRTEFRHYTPAVLDTVAGRLTIIVQRHGSGPGEELIESWSVDDDVRVCRWSSVRSFRWTDDTSPVIVLGDATVISLAMSVTDRAAAEGRSTLIVLEVDVDDVAATRELVPGAVVVAADTEPGVAIDGWLAGHLGDVAALPDPIAYLAGHGQSIQRQRTFLREQVGLDRRQVRTQPYWATGKVGL